MRVKMISSTVMIAVLLLGFSTIGSASQTNGKQKDEPTVILAVAPVFPPIALAKGVKGEVVIEVTIDAKGKVASATVFSGAEFLRESAKKAAMKWEFITVTESEKPRAVRLTFAFSYADASEPMRSRPEFTTLFKPPYRIEVISQPFTIT